VSQYMLDLPIRGPWATGSRTLGRAQEGRFERLCGARALG
jgi:hypothetical protein